MNENEEVEINYAGELELLNMSGLYAD